MPDDYTPFTINDSQVYLYLVNAQDLPMGSVYLGGCAESTTLEQSLTTRRLEYHGIPNAPERHDDEEHLIEMKNVWLHNASQAIPVMPAGHRRNTRYALVIIWQDDDAGVWTKRTYVGATSRGQRVEDATYQTLRFRAEALVESAGLLLNGGPSILPGVAGTVRYIGDDGSLDLYSYDADTASLTVINPDNLTGRAQITLDDTSAQIFFDGVRALNATASATRATTFVATGSTFLDQTPRIEFYLGDARVASLGADGTLVVINLSESGNPELVDFEIRNAQNEWLFSLAAPRSYFPEIVEAVSP